MYSSISVLLTIQIGVVYNFGRVCLFVRLSVCQTITYESLDV